MEDEFDGLIHCWQSRMATAVSFLHRQPSSSPHAWEPSEVPKVSPICTYLDRRKCGSACGLALAETTQFPLLSSSVGPLTSVFNCPAGMSTIWMAEMFPSFPPTLTSSPSPVSVHKFPPSFLESGFPPCPASNAKIATKKKNCMSPE